MNDETTTRVLANQALDGVPGVWKEPVEFEANELLRAIGKELKSIKVALNILVFVALVSSVLYALWLGGVIDVTLSTSRF